MRCLATFAGSVAVALTAMLPAAPSVAQDTSPQQALADAWCRAVMAMDEAAATALMTPDLQQDVALARIANAAFATAHPGEKPPLGDGLPLTAFADAVGGCMVSDLTPQGALMTFTAAGTGTGSAAGSAMASWTDALEFVPGPGGALLLSDVLYAPERMVRMTDALTAMAETGE